MTVSRSTDRTVRALLGAKGMKRGELSRFVEQAVEARLFYLTAEKIKQRNADISPAKLQELIDESLRETRAERLRKRPAVA